MDEDRPRKRPMSEPPQEDMQQKALKVEDALTYLDKVKTQFGDQPHIYNKFLEIMKNFKAEVIDTPGVIKHVQALFRGHNNLILGFNTFLPPGCRIELSQLPPDGNEQGLGPVSRPLSGQGELGMPQPLVAPPLGQYQSPYHYYQGAYPLPPGYMVGPNGQMVVAMPQQPPLPLQQQQQQHEGDDMGASQPVEFDQAISYVTKIKRRFHDDADTYKSFLEILHTYQKEQKSIKEVLDQVSELFRDHPDLLREFTYFLPDNVRDKAKMEIARISARRNKEDQRAKEKKAAERKPRKQPQMAAGTGGLRSSKSLSSQSPDVEEEPLYFEGHIPKLERRLFARIKSALASRERWAEFLKCLYLFSQEVITRSELIALASDIFAAHPELLDELDRLLASRGATDNNDEDAWFSMPMSDIDFSQSRRCSPSYRALPVTYPKLPCSERTALCRSVLNDTWVSVPTGSEDFSFKSMRKNVYEEALFKCEDDRYEFDMVIDANMSTIRALEALQAEIAAADKGTFRYQLERRALNVIHLKCICRVYGTRGTEVLELLSKAPAAAIPVILVRLKQKDEEWRRQRIELNKEWKEVLERNYHKSLDHRSFYFKQNEKKALNHKTLLGEIRDQPDKHMMLAFPDAFGHRSAASLVQVWADKNLVKSEADKLCATLDRFIAGFKVRPKPSGKPDFEVKQGAKVFTRYGSGVVSSVAHAAGECTVKIDKDSAVVVPLNEALEDVPLEDKWDFNICVGAPGYLFLRLYAVLCQRLGQADALCQLVDKEPAKTAVKHVVERQMGEDKEGGAGGCFSSLMTSIKGLLSGSLDANKFEEDCCALLGSGSFFIFTIDKIVGMCSRALLALVQDERAIKANEALLAYKQAKTAANAAALYRAESECLATGLCACVVVKLLPGLKPAPRRLDANNLEEQNMWEQPPRLELNFLDAIPYTNKAPPGFARGQSPLPSSDPVEMGELEVCVPWRVKVRAEGTQASAAAAAAEAPPRKVSQRLEDKTNDVVFITAVYVCEKVSGSDDVFRRIVAHGKADDDTPWWRIESLLQAKDQVAQMEEEEEEESGEKEDV